MRQEEFVGKVQTVLGIIARDCLGATLPHEHLIVDVSASFREPSEVSQRELAYQPINLENLNWVRHNWTKNLGNNLLQDQQVAIDEAMFYKKAGGDTIVELTGCSSMGRNPLALMHIAKATGLNVIMSTGFYEVYTASEVSSIAGSTEEDLTEQMVREITIGVGDSGLRAGIIGEIGTAWPLSAIMRRILRAGAQAQRRTGAALNIHPPLYASTKLPRQKDHEDVIMEVIKIINDAGADLSRTIISHVDLCCFTPIFRKELAETGCYLEYDNFGLEGYPDEDDLIWDTPNDAQRINEIMQLIDEGYVNQILVSCDHCMKHQLRRYGGWGYDHILTTVVPQMRHKGMLDEQIHMLLVENPKRILTFVPAKA